VLERFIKAKRNKEYIALGALDIEGAYDSLRHDKLIEIMEKSNMPEDFTISLTYQKR
jgi:hypothetical protein